MKLMQISSYSLFRKIHVVDISRRARLYTLILISVAMLVLSANFYRADAVYGQASVLPVYVLFFILMYMACILVEYVSLWCERDRSFHCARVVVHGMALMLVTYEMGMFYGADRDVYSQLPSYSITKVLSHIVLTPSIIDNSRI